MLQVTVEERDRGELVVGELQVQQSGYVEHSLGNSFITQLVVVQPHKRQVREALEVVSEENNKTKTPAVKFHIQPTCVCSSAV